MKNKIFGPATLQQIKDRCDLPDLIRCYISLSNKLKALCPFHSEQTPSFSIHKNKKTWHCFGCGRGGDAFTFVQLIEGVNFAEAVTILAEKAGVALPHSERFKGYIRRRWETKQRLLGNLENWRRTFKFAAIRRRDELLVKRQKLPHKTSRDSWDARDYLREQVIDYRFDLLEQKMRRLHGEIEKARKEILNG